MSTSSAMEFILWPDCTCNCIISHLFFFWQSLISTQLLSNLFLSVIPDFHFAISVFSLFMISLASVTLFCSLPPLGYSWFFFSYVTKTSSIGFHPFLFFCPASPWSLLGNNISFVIFKVLTWCIPCTTVTFFTVLNSFHNFRRSFRW